MNYQYMNPYLTQGYLPVQQQTPASSIIWVHGEQEANAYPVAPNNAVALWDSDAPVIYLRKADASGKPTMQAYDLVERAVKKEDSDLMKTISAMQAEIDSLKNDVYGIAGKKRKKEEDE